MKIDSVIAVAGWEERFQKGLLKDLEAYGPTHVLLFAFEEYLSSTQQPRTELKRVAEAKSVQYEEVHVRRDPIQLWSNIRATFSAPQWTGRSVVVDISTMPREVIWWTLSCLRSLRCNIRYVYYKPSQYARDWLTRDTDRPRLVYQHSGVSAFGKQTCLLLLTGFDSDRAAQLIQFFEPRLVLIGLQTGDQYDNQVKNIEQSKRLLERTPHIRFFDVDAFSSDHGFAAIETAVASELPRFNIVATSLGPKPCAIALWRLHTTHPDIALAYAPSRQFNPAYSDGIGDVLTGVV